MDVPAKDITRIGSSVVVRGEISGSEDLFVDGQLEGTIVLKGNNLTVGPQGRVKAAITAKNVILFGRMEGNINASERTELRKTAVLAGDVTTQRISIEDGAFFQGKLDVQTQTAKAAAVSAD
ncbi:MAG: polymer-forming cytoskeletal protein [Acidobacteriales bacterium]|nr:polymer-forming cytoskeletal protein [Terriglobales bacterium]